MAVLVLTVLASSVGWHLTLFFYWSTANRISEQKLSFYFPSSCLAVAECYKMPHAREYGKCSLQSPSSSCVKQTAAGWTGNLETNINNQSNVMPGIACWDLILFFKRQVIGRLQFCISCLAWQWLEWNSWLRFWGYTRMSRISWHLHIVRLYLPTKCFRQPPFQLPGAEMQSSFSTKYNSLQLKVKVETLWLAQRLFKYVGHSEVWPNSKFMMSGSFKPS